MGCSVVVGCSHDCSHDSNPGAACCMDSEQASSAMAFFLSTLEAHTTACVAPYLTLPPPASQLELLQSHNGGRHLLR